MSWKDLSIREKADVIRASVANCNFNLSSIRNEFDMGGEKETAQEQPKLKKVDIPEWFKEEGNRGRAVNIPAMEQLQDSLVARGWGLPQRLAIMATAAQEMDKNGAASRGVGGNGYLGLSFQRMPEEYLDDTPEGRGRQINYIFEDLLTTHSDNWLNGGSGGPKIISGQDGFNQFWENNNVWNATQVLNKSYIRPRDREEAWNNRAAVAKAMQKHMYEDGGEFFADFDEYLSDYPYLYRWGGFRRRGIYRPSAQIAPRVRTNSHGESRRKA